MAIAVRPFRTVNVTVPSSTIAVDGLLAVTWAVKDSPESPYVAPAESTVIVVSAFMSSTEIVRLPLPDPPSSSVTVKVTS